ncbi:MAG: response regulator transcription factor [Gemmatimonadaceae bacterium]
MDDLYSTPPSTATIPTAGAADSTVIVVAEIRLYRDGLVRLLDGSKYVHVLDSAATVTDALTLARVLRPQVILFDVATPGMLSAAREIGAISGAKLVAFAVEDTERGVLACAEAGLSGYVSCAGTFDELLAAVRRVAHNEVECSPLMAGTLFRHVGALSAGRAPLADVVVDPLTGRERQIAALLEEGRSNKEIARELGIEVATVKNHVHHVLEKLGVGRRGEAAARVRAGFVR